MHSKVSELKVKGKRGMRVNGLVEGTPLEWKIDTGAVNTFITEDVYYSIIPEHRPVLERAIRKFETADGSELKLLGTARMLLTFGDVNVYFRVYIGGVKSNLLGQDFMTKYKCQWEYRSDSLVFCELPFAEERRGCNIVTIEDSVVPPKHECILNSKLSCETNISEGILVPLKRFIHTYGLVLAHVLVNAKNNVLYVRVFNPGDREVCIKGNTQIAILAPVNFISDPLEQESVCRIQENENSPPENENPPAENENPAVGNQFSWLEKQIC